MTRPRRVTRRNALKLGAAAAALPLVHIRTAGAAGKLAVGFWDHWVPAGNEVMRKQVKAWAEKNKVEVTVDFITSDGNKILMTAAAEAQAKTGHDVMPFYSWDVADLRRPAGAGRRRHEDADRQIRQVRPDREVSGDSRRATGGRCRPAPGHCNLTRCARISLLKQHGRHRHHGDVSGARRSDPARPQRTGPTTHS